MLRQQMFGFKGMYRLCNSKNSFKKPCLRTSVTEPRHESHSLRVRPPFILKLPPLQSTAMALSFQFLFSASYVAARPTASVTSNRSVAMGTAALTDTDLPVAIETLFTSAAIGLGRVVTDSIGVALIATRSTSINC